MFVLLGALQTAVAYEGGVLATDSLPAERKRRVKSFFVLVSALLLVVTIYIGKLNDTGQFSSEEAAKNAQQQLGEMQSAQRQTLTGIGGVQTQLLQLVGTGILSKDGLRKVSEIQQALDHLQADTASSMPPQTPLRSQTSNTAFVPPTMASPSSAATPVGPNSAPALYIPGAAIPGMPTLQKPVPNYQAINWEFNRMQQQWFIAGHGIAFGEQHPSPGWQDKNQAISNMVKAQVHDYAALRPAILVVRAQALGRTNLSNAEKDKDQRQFNQFDTALLDSTKSPTLYVSDPDIDAMRRYLADLLKVPLY